MTVFIYTLSDPDTLQVVYVGKSVNLKNRHRTHLGLAKLKDYKQSRKGAWIQGLLATGKQPIMEHIETVDWQDGIKTEHYWIWQFRAWGFNLLNSADESGLSPEFWKANPARQVHIKNIQP